MILLTNSFSLKVMNSAAQLRILFLILTFSFQAVAGLAADGRQIVARTKSEANSYERFVVTLFLELWRKLPIVKAFFLSIIS